VSAASRRERTTGTSIPEGTLLKINVTAVIDESRIAELRLTSLSVSNIEGGRGQIATDLVPDKDGFTRIEFAAGNISEVRRAVVVRRLLEIETYRVFALLGLPLALSDFWLFIAVEVLAFALYAVSFNVLDAIYQTVTTITTVGFREVKLTYPPTETLPIYMGVIGAVTTIAAQKLVTLGWKAITGDDPPTATDPDTPLGVAVSWALASGIGIGVTQLLTTRFAARRFSTQMGGHAPKVPNIRLKI